MRILVVSDTHRKHDNLDIAIEKVMPDRIYHLGDGEGGEDYIEAVAECPLEIVRGNCDFGSNLPAEVVMSLGRHVVMLTHGHYYNVNYGTQMLVEAAKEKGADVVFYGHTHVPAFEQKNGNYYVNPGSVSIPKEGSRHSYMLWENGVFTWKDVETGEIWRTERIEK